MKKCTPTILLINFILILTLSVQAQKHETGILGGWLYGNPEGKANSTTMHGGWNAGGYYRYTWNKWLGIESGLEYTRKKIYVNDEEWESSLSVPLNAIVFPSFRFSIFGGIFFKNHFEHITMSYFIPQTTQQSIYKVEKKPVWGFTAGLKWNMKYCRLGFSYKQDLTSWMKNFKEIQSHSLDMREAFKGFSMNITAEIPIWRSKEK